MKFMSKNSRFAKILAIAFSLLMLITATDLPIFVGVVASAADKFTVIVKEKADSSVAVEGATVTVTPAESTGLAEQTGTTDEDGKVEFDVFTEYFKNGGEDFEATYKVTAENYAEADKTVTVAAEGFTVEISKNEISGIDIKACDVEYDGAFHDAVEVSGTLDGDIVYYSEDGTTYSTSEITLQTPGEKTVYVKITRNGYEDKVYGPYTATVKKGNLKEKVFVSPANEKYNGSAFWAVTVLTTPDLDATVYYSVDGGKTFKETRPTIKDVGELKVTVKVTAGDNYNDYIETFVARVSEGELTDEFITDNFKIDVYNKVYDGETHNAVVVTPPKSLQNIPGEGYKIEYSEKEDGEYRTEPIKIKDAGDKTVYVRVSKKGYEPKVLGPYTAKIEKAEIKGVTATGYDATYVSGLETFDAITAVGGTADGDVITYSDDGETYSENIPQVSKVTDTGKYYVKIYRNENYKEKIIEVDVTISAGKLEMVFEDVPDKLIYNENNSFDYKVTFYEFIDGVKVISQDSEELANHLTYSIVNAPEGTTIDGSKVTYTGVGEFTVRATIIGELDNYDVTEKTSSTEYSLEIVYADFPETPYIISEADYYQKITDSDGFIRWYRYNAEGGVAITPAEGWVISESNALGQDSNAWKTEITRKEAGRYDLSVAFKDENNNITNMMTVVPFAIDASTPVIESVEVTLWEDSVDKAINYLTFGIFANDSLKFKVTISDEEASSGIKTVELYAGDVVYTADVEYTDGKYVAVFKLPKEELAENFSYITNIMFKVDDNVCNSTDKVKMVEKGNNVPIDRIVIENKIPVISEIIYKSNGNLYDIKEDDKVIERYYDDDVEFSFSVTDSDSGVEEVYATINDVEVINKDVLEDSEKLIRYDFVVSTAGIEADEDGKHLLEIFVKDFAGNTTSKSATVYVDKTAPVITDFNFTVKDNGSEVKNEALDQDIIVLEDYGYYFNTDVTVAITAKDYKVANETKTGIKEITYKAVDLDGNVVLSEKVSTGGTDEATISFDVKADFKGQIFAFATDMLDNKLPEDKGGFDAEAGKTVYDPEDYNTLLADEGYVYPNGVILESSESHIGAEGHIVIKRPATEFTQNNGVPLYAEDIDVAVTVKDIYAGIRNVKVTVAPGYGETKVVSDVTVPNSIGGDTLGGWTLTRGDKNLVSAMSNTITVSNNSNDIKFIVEMTDRAGNTSKEEVVFGIDKTKPEIEISYASGELHDEKYINYFRTNRVATITITERNFRAENVNFAFTNTDKVIPSIDLNAAKNWTTHKVNKGENPDNTTYTATVVFEADGDYTFDISCVDNVGYGSNKIHEIFTIDKTLPLISVVYDNNSARNGNYYNDKRIATVTITEHNFDKSRVQFSIFSENKSPAISGWRSNGDVHTATISYTEDSRYTFDVAFRDMAGNSIADFAQQEFHVDTTAPEVTLKGIVDKSANADKGNIGFELTATDKNFDTFEPTVKAILYKNGSFKTETVKIGATTTVTNGKKYNVVNITDDGIYSVTCTVVDKAGNTYSKVYLQNKNGDLSLQSRTQASPLVTFTVNREGSVFYLDNYTKGLVKDYYVKDVTDFVTIVEINADPIIENTITINGKKLVKDTDYTVSSNNDSSSWYKYTYKIDKEVFAAEGDYNVIVSTKDKAENDAFSDIKDTEVKFVVDRTAPIVTVAGLESNGKYKTDLQQVLLIPSDNGGLLKSVIVRTVDENGSVLKEIINLTGDQLDEAIAAGQISFNLEEGVRQHVQIICEDYAGNISGSEEEEKFTNITVSTNAFVIFWATEWLRWTTIIIATLLIALIVFVIVKKRKKA